MDKGEQLPHQCPDSHLVVALKKVTPPVETAVAYQGRNKPDARRRRGSLLLPLERKNHNKLPAFSSIYLNIGQWVYIYATFL